MKTKLKLTSKKLNSGGFQVNSSTEGNFQNFYGYSLAEPFTPVHEVIATINQIHQANVQSPTLSTKPPFFAW